MRRALVLFSSCALLPAALGSAAVRAETFVMLCSGAALALALPLSAPAIPGSGDAPCCTKGCHSGSCRKRIDRAQ